MKHFFQKGKDPLKPTLLLLHGTGGNESSLLPLAGKIDEDTSTLSVRGNVLENGMPRFSDVSPRVYLMKKILFFVQNNYMNFSMKHQKNMSSIAKM